MEYNTRFCAMCIPTRCQTMRCQTLRCASYRQFASHGRIKLGDLHPTAESNSAMCIPPQNQTRDVHPTKESDSAMCIPLQNQTHDVHPTEESDSAMCIPPRNQTRQFASHGRINSAMCIPQQNQTQRCASHRGIRLSNVHPTEESDSVVCKTVHHAEESVTCLSWPKRVCFYMRFKKKNFPCNMPLY